jgi:hypothetical protein
MATSSPSPTCCGSCLAPLRPAARFCDVCGAKLGTAAQASSEASSALPLPNADDAVESSAAHPVHRVNINVAIRAVGVLLVLLVIGLAASAGVADSLMGVGSWGVCIPAFVAAVAALSGNEFQSKFVFICALITASISLIVAAVSAVADSRSLWWFQGLAACVDSDGAFSGDPTLHSDANFCRTSYNAAFPSLQSRACFCSLGSVNVNQSWLVNDNCASLFFPTNAARQSSCFALASQVHALLTASTALASLVALVLVALLVSIAYALRGSEPTGVLVPVHTDVHLNRQLGEAYLTLQELEREARELSPPVRAG